MGAASFICRGIPRPSNNQDSCRCFTSTLCYCNLDVKPTRSRPVDVCLYRVMLVVSFLIVQRRTIQTSYIKLPKDLWEKNCFRQPFPDSQAVMCHQKTIEYQCEHREPLPTRNTAYLCDLASPSVFPNGHCWIEAKRWYDIVRLPARCPKCRMSVIDGTGCDKPCAASSAILNTMDRFRFMLSSVPETTRTLDI